MNTTEKLSKVYKNIDQLNAEDPNIEIVNNKEIAKELIYGMRMTEMLNEFEPEASLALNIAARGQHICRWEIPRKDYEMNRVGYLTWRKDLKKFHAEKLKTILTELDFETEIINRVSFLIEKKKLKKDNETQTLEDVICLVFLKYYYESFYVKHNDEKVIDIIQKTWKKMSEKGHEKALKISYSKNGLELIKKALGA